MGIIELAEYCSRTLPRSLSDITKKKLMSKSPEEIAQLFQKTIEKINGGSTVPIDVLVDEELIGKCYQ